MPNTRLVKMCYIMMFNDDIRGHVNWASSVRNSLQKHGFGYIWENQDVVNEKYFLMQYVNRLKDIYLQEWHVSVSFNSK